MTRFSGQNKQPYHYICMEPCGPYDWAGSRPLLSTRPPRRVVQHTALMTSSRSQLRRWIFSASAIFSGLVSALPWDGAKPTEAGAAAAGYALGWTPKPTEAPIPRFGSGSEGYSPYDPKGLFRRDQNTDRLCGYVSGDIGEEPPPAFRLHA
jgi:hypothetical protein